MIQSVLRYHETNSNYECHQVVLQISEYNEEILEENRGE